MTQGYSLIVIAGALSKDPEMRYTSSGQPVTAFSIPVNRQYTTSSGENVQETTWHKISVWGKAAEPCHKYLRKGSVVLVEGRLVSDKATGGPRIWQRQDGSSGASFEVNASSVKFLWTGKPSSGGDEVEGTSVTSEVPEEADLPF